MRPAGTKPFSWAQRNLLPSGRVLFLLDRGQGAGDAAAHVVDVAFVALGVLLDQHFAGDFLLRQRGDSRRFGNVGQGELFGDFAHQAPLQEIQIDHGLLILRMFAKATSI